MKESDIQRTIMKRLTRFGRIFRNNVGMAWGKDGRPIRFGLAKGSSDLIGWTEIDGVAVFTAVEVKTKKGKPTEAQLNFIEVVRRSGGIAGIARSDDEAEEMILTQAKEIKRKLNSPTGRNTEL